MNTEGKGNIAEKRWKGNMVRQKIWKTNCVNDMGDNKVVMVA